MTVTKQRHDSPEQAIADLLERFSGSGGRYRYRVARDSGADMTTHDAMGLLTKDMHRALHARTIQTPLADSVAKFAGAQLIEEASRRVPERQQKTHNAVQIALLDVCVEAGSKEAVSILAGVMTNHEFSPYTKGGANAVLLKHQQALFVTDNPRSQKIGAVLQTAQNALLLQNAGLIKQP